MGEWGGVLCATTLERVKGELWVGDACERRSVVRRAVFELSQLVFFFGWGAGFGKPDHKNDSTNCNKKKTNKKKRGICFPDLWGVASAPNSSALLYLDVSFYRGVLKAQNGPVVPRGNSGQQLRRQFGMEA